MSFPVKNGCCQKKVEPTIGIEPMDLFLTKEALYRLSYVGFFLNSDAFLIQAKR